MGSPDNTACNSLFYFSLSAGTDLADPVRNNNDNQEDKDAYCEAKAASESCEETDENSCERVWKARPVSDNPTDGWCCFDPQQDGHGCLYFISPP